jgi:SAM-dependent methyltransferase
MSHPEQREWCKEVQSLFPEHFKNSVVLDFGSLDINGNNRGLFIDCDYTGIDLQAGNNVDVICRAHVYNQKELNSVDTIITTECLEHDTYWEYTLRHALHLLRSGGLLIVTCAGEGRPPHGTHTSEPWSSPFTNDYYKNLTEADLRLVLNDYALSDYRYDTKGTDTRFWGIKK